jgi:uncharacterized protein YaiI (UPF0178 family)
MPYIDTMKCEICGHELISAKGITFCPNAINHPITQEQIERKQRRELKLKNKTAKMSPEEREYFLKHYRY